MPVIFHWIFTGCLNRSLVTMTGLLAIYAIVEAFDKARYLGRGMDGAMLIEYLLLKAPFMVSEFMPVIVLVAVSIYLIELSRYHEIVAVRAAGLGINKLLTPLLAVALLAAIFSFLIGEWVTPVTNKRLDTIERVHIQHKKPSKHGIQWLKDGRQFFRLTPLGNNQFSLMMLNTDAKGGWVRRIDSPLAQFSNGQWHLTDVHVSTPSAEMGMLLKHVPQMDIASQTGPETVELPKPRHMHFAELYRYIKGLEHAGLSANTYIYALHRKFSAPLACLLMVILAAALCLHTGNRSGRASWDMLLAIAMGLFFYVLGNAGYLLASGDRLPAAYAAWLPSLAFGGIAIFLLLKREGY
jgi:LPS export ABC transporter permease LptG